MSSRALGIVALLAATLLFAVYWPGLHGPLLLDDFENLAPLSRYRSGQLTAAGVIFGNHSGMLGRPVSMASFVLDANIWGAQLFGFKLTNLALHLACAAIVWRLLSRLLRRDPLLDAAHWLPLWLAVLWAALPIQVSTVLYVIQRMAILSALLTLAALMVYVHGRECYEANRTRAGAIWIWLVFPAVVGLATLAKENGALAIPLAAVIELAWFRTARRPRPVTAFFTVTLVVPLFAALALFALHPEMLTNGYAGRDFTLIERLLTQSRILWDYVGAALVPNGPKLGLFHDDYPLSRGLLTPATTLLAIGGWMIAIGLAILLRRMAPTFTFGVGFFLAAHAMESSVLPLELYFEHRNYLASVGLLVAVAGLGGLAIKQLRGITQAMQWALLALCFVVPATYVAATHARARVWSSEDTFYAQEETHSPNSPRLYAILGARAMDRGDLQASLHYLLEAERNGPRRERMTGTIRRMLAYCMAAKTVPEALYAEAEQRNHLPLTQYGMVAFDALAQHAESGWCESDRLRLARIGLQWSEASGMPANAHAAWRTRYNSARLLAAAGHMEQAAAVSMRAFTDSSANFGVGVLAFQTCASLGNMPACAPIARQLYATANREDLQAVSTAEQFINAASAAAEGN